MKLEDIESHWESDCAFDVSNILGEVQRIPKLHSKYLKMLIHEKLMKQQLDQQKDTLYTDRWVYYTGKAEPATYKDAPFNLKLSQKQEVETHIKSDPSMQKLILKLAIQESKVEFLESVVKMINARSFLIRDYIEWSRFTNGVG